MVDTPLPGRRGSQLAIAGMISKHPSSGDGLQCGRCWLIRVATMDNCELAEWREYRAEPTIERRNKLVERYMWLARKLAAAAAVRIEDNTGMRDFDDLYQVACIGLLDAVQRFDPEVKYQPATFFWRRILGSISDYLRKTDRLPQSMRKLAKAIDRWEATLGRDADDSEVVQQFGVERPKEMACKSIDSRSDDGGQLADMLECRTQPVSLDGITELMRGLCERDRLILLMRFVDDMTMMQIAEQLGVSDGRVCQLLHAIFAAIRKRINAGDVESRTATA